MRYDRGHLYFDKCGQTINEITEKLSDFNFRAIEEGNIAVLDNLKDRMTVSFAWNKLDISQIAVQNVNKFQNVASVFSDIVLKNLSIDRSLITRIGNRYWFVLKAPNEEFANEVIRKSGTIKTDWSNLDKLGGNFTKGSSTVVLQGDKYFHRIVLTAIKKTEPGVVKTKEELEYFPELAILIDVDVYQDNPKSLDVKGFIHSAYKMMEHNAIKVIC